ncbi:hypothetical protein CLOSTASPAR_04893, partial [[Clostridium] asparagiforme DSM 15981]
TRNRKRNGISGRMRPGTRFWMMGRNRRRRDERGYRKPKTRSFKT